MVEGARLESVCTSNGTVGSNPTLSVFSFLNRFEADPKRCLVAEEARAAGFGGSCGAAGGEGIPTEFSTRKCRNH